MAKRIKLDQSGDTEELQALFDSIAAAPPKPKLEVVAPVDADGDSDELQALFDAVSDDYAVKATAQAAAPAAESAAPGPEEVFDRIGHMARELHDALHALGYDKMLEDTARRIPDARQRLHYIAQTTEQAASRVLNATDIAKPLQDALGADAQALAGRWDRLVAGELSVDEFKRLAGDTHGFLQRAHRDARATSEQLMDIVMAQDFQDLTGQVIKKVVELAQSLENRLLNLLVEVIPETRRDGAAGLLNGPVIDAAGRADVVTDQGQVDELLESLGF